MHKDHSLLIVIFCCLLFLASCSSVKQAALRSDLKKLPETSPIISNYFMGLALYDPLEEKYISTVNANKYFTPASNTKILTLATWLSNNLDSIPSFTYYFEDNNLYIRPLGDPTFLHPDFPLQKSLEFLLKESYDTLFIIPPDQKIEPFGSGWAWDDYNYSYQPERSYLPLYGNTVHAFAKNGETNIVPFFFENYVEYGASKTFRQLDYNYFELPINKERKDTMELQVPFRSSDELMIRLLQDTLAKPVSITLPSMKKENEQFFNSYDRLPVLATMMLRSDNFLAEQLLLNAQLFEGFANTSEFISHNEETVFKNVPQSLEWVDGSGLSRYNMFTPMSLVSILDIIYKQLSWEEISLIFPKGGYSGTIKRWYWGEEPYVFAKTGTLRHNHCLSGYIQAKSGRWLIFSFMNNHYTNGSTEVKQEMQRVLEAIRDAY
jgi:D-alanyl-D-alanine carboxypeptidase/D-alanyl-D-alanine-endopeptidase (penicillin-binding protein 4)